MSKLDLGPIGMTVQISADGKHLDEAAALEELGYSAPRAPGRFVAGLGGPQVPRPLRPLNDYLDQLDQGEPPVPAGRRILAALGPRKLEVARERAAGAVLLLVTPGYTRAARSILGSGAALVISQLVVLDTDAARAREAARGSLRFP